MSEADLKSFAAIKRREEKEILLNDDSDDEKASIADSEADSADELNSEADLDLSDSEDDVDDFKGDNGENVDGDGGRLNLDQIRRRALRKGKKTRKAKQNVIENFVPVKLSTLRKAAGIIPATPDGLNKRRKRGKTEKDEEEDEDSGGKLWQELKDGAKEVLAYYAGEETYAVRRLELSDCCEVLGKLYDTQWRRFVIKNFPKSYILNLKGFSKYYKPASKTLLTACKSKYCPPFYIVDLLEDGADPNIQEEDTENTPLHYMCRRGNYQAVRFLVEAGAHPNAQNITRRTPLLAACDTRRTGEQIRIVRYLLTLPGVNETLEFRDNGGNTAAINAIFKNNVWILRELLLAGARVTEDDPGMGYDSAYHVAKWVYAAGLLQDVDQLPPRALQEDYNKQSLLWKLIGARGHYYYAPILLYQTIYKYNADLCLRMCQNKKSVEDKIKYPPKPRRAVLLMADEIKQKREKRRQDKELARQRREHKAKKLVSRMLDNEVKEVEDWNRDRLNMAKKIDDAYKKGLRGQDSKDAHKWVLKQWAKDGQPGHIYWEKEANKGSTYIAGEPLSPKTKVKPIELGAIIEARHNRTHDENERIHAYSGSPAEKAYARASWVEKDPEFKESENGWKLKQRADNMGIIDREGAWAQRKMKLPFIVPPTQEDVYLSSDSDEERKTASRSPSKSPVR